MQKLRGIEIFQMMGEWLYLDTLQPTESGWEDRPCGHCGLSFSPEGHDGCLGTLPNVSNACCGHGDQRSAYIQFNDGNSFYSKEAADFINRILMLKELSGNSNLY